MINILKNIINGRKWGWFGDYSSWEKVKNASTGYDEDLIIETVTKSMLLVKNGHAVAERDSVIFNEIQYSWPLLANILHVAALNGGTLNVLDFGGSLGSTYFQNKLYLDELKHVTWSVIEQPKFVEIGKRLFQNNILKFTESIDNSVKLHGAPDLIILSCVLPYLENPYLLLDEIIEKRFKFILIENTPLQSIENRDILTLQKVHPSIYNASYPCWLLNKQKVFNRFKNTYSLIVSYNNDSKIPWKNNIINYNGALFKFSK